MWLRKMTEPPVLPYTLSYGGQCQQQPQYEDGGSEGSIKEDLPQWTLLNSELPF